MKKNFLAMVAAGLLAGPMAAQAIPLTYDFTVNGGPTGPLAGVAASGFFTFDDSIIPVGGGFVGQTGLFDDLSFVWNGFAFDETTANTAALIFSASGTLVEFLFGTDCNSAGFCTTNGADPGSFAINGPPRPTATWVYGVAGTLGFVGTVESTTLRVAGVPEPGTLALFGLGLAVLGVMRRRCST